MTNSTRAIQRIQTGVRNLDALVRGGIPKGSVTLIGGPPGSGKTILCQMLCFHNASPTQRVLYFSTLSEPTAKTLRHLSQFSFFDPTKLDGGGIRFIDLGEMIRSKGLEETVAVIMAHVKEVRPAIVVIDSFKVFDDLARSREELRKFGYELAVNLMAWQTTTFLIGEYSAVDLATNPLSSIVDAIMLVTQRADSGEQQRFIQVSKMRGTNHSRDEHSFLITDDGAEVFAPKVTLQREDRGGPNDRLQTGIVQLDALLGEGIPRGSSILISGVAGTGKTILCMEFVYRGALAGEKGIIFTFEETAERLRASADGLGWDLDGQIERGMIEIVFIPQPDILVERHLLMMRERVEQLKARRIAVDSISVFLHKVDDPQSAREKVFQLATIVQNSHAVGFFATDIPYGSKQISRIGVEETVVDGLILLSSVEQGMERERYLDVYKLRNTAHLKGRHNMVIGQGGIQVFPRYLVDGELAAAPAAIDPSRRLPSGLPVLDQLLGGGLLDRSVTMVSGSSGIGKSTLALQFIAEGARRGERGLFVSLEEGPEQLLRSAAGLGLGLHKAIKSGLVDILYLAREHIQASQFPSILTTAIEAKQVRRVVLDGVSHIATEGLVPDELRQLLFVLVNRFKALGATTFLTLESKSLHSVDTISDLGFSPIADNIILLRYEAGPGELRPSLTVVKTRASAHSFARYYYAIGKGGIRLSASVDPLAPPLPPAAPRPPVARKSARKPAPSRRRPA